MNRLFKVVLALVVLASIAGVLLGAGEVGKALAPSLSPPNNTRLEYMGNLVNRNIFVQVRDNKLQISKGNKYHQLCVEELIVDFTLAVPASTANDRAIIAELEKTTLTLPRSKKTFSNPDVGSWEESWRDSHYFVFHVVFMLDYHPASELAGLWQGPNFKQDVPIEYFPCTANGK